MLKSIDVRAGSLKRALGPAAEGGLSGVVVAGDAAGRDSPPSSPRLRQTTFGATLDFIEALCDASSRLTSFPPVWLSLTCTILVATLDRQISLGATGGDVPLPVHKAYSTHMSQALRAMACDNTGAEQEDSAAS